HEEGTALQTVQVAAFQALLHRYGDHADEGDGPEPGLPLYAGLARNAGLPLASFRLAPPAAALDCPLSRLPLLTGAERHQLLGEWNQTAAPSAREATLS